MSVREEHIGGQRLILGDSAAILPGLGRFDLVLTDPPYGINAARKRNSQKWGWTDFAGGEWDKARPSDDLMRLALAAGKDCIVWGGNYFTSVLPPSERWLIWDKCQEDFSLADCEVAWCSTGGAIRRINYPRSRALQDGKVHPTQKPLAVMEWCLTFAPKAKSVIDPFMGSGTTLVACQRRGLSGTGIELDPVHFASACRRVDEATRQPDMFVIPVPAPVQEQLI